MNLFDSKCIIKSLSLVLFSKLSSSFCIESNIYDEEYHGLFSDDFVKQIISNYMAYNFEENTESNAVLMDEID